MAKSTIKDSTQPELIDNDTKTPAGDDVDLSNLTQKVEATPSTTNYAKEPLTKGQLLYAILWRQYKTKHFF